MKPLERLRIAYRAFRAAPLLAARLEYGIDERPDTLHYQDLYSTSGAVYSCIKRRADAYSRPILKVYRSKDGKIEELLDHPLRHLLDRVNPFWTRVQLWRQTETDLLWHGNAYWGLEKAGKQPGEIWRMRPDWMKVVPDRKLYIKGYLYNVEGIEYPWSPDEVIHFRYANPLNEYYGLSPLAAARYSAELGIDAIKFNRNFFTNASTAASALVSKVALSKEQADDLTRRWDAAFTGISKAHKTAVLSPDLDIKNISISQRDAEWMNAMKWSLSDVARVYGVPEPLIGEEKAVYKNIEEAEAAFWYETLIPELIWIEGILNTELVPFFNDSSLFVAFDISMIEAIHGAVDAIMERHAKLLDRGVETINEVRRKERIGDDVTWGDVAWLPMNLMPMGRTKEVQKEVEAKRLDLALKGSPATESSQNNPRPIPKETAVVDSVGSAISQRQAEEIREERFGDIGIEFILLDEITWDTEVEGEIEGILIKFFETESKIIARAYSRTIRQMGYDWDRWKKLEKPIAQSTGRQLEAAAEGAFTEVEATAEFNLKHIKAMEWAQDNAALRVTEIADATRNSIHAVVSKGIEEGWARDKILNSIVENTAFSKDRAKLIARTETQRAYNQGNLRGYKESGVVAGKRWLSMDDPKVSPECQANEAAGAVEIESNFPSGHDAPPAHPNCRCRILPEMEADLMVEDIRPAGDEWIDELTRDERRAISGTPDSWGAEGYRSIREAQRTGKMTAEMEQRIKYLESALNKSKPFKGTVYRGIGDLTDDAYRTISETRQFKWEALTSATKDKEIADGFVYGRTFGKRVLLKINQKTGIDLGSFSLEEAEVVLRKGAMYKVVETKSVIIRGLDALEMTLMEM